MSDQATTDTVSGLMAHLIELRSRLLRASAAVLVIFLCLMPFAARIFDLLAAPMMNALPQGSRMIATGVTAPFMIPVQFVLLLAFVAALPYVLYQAWAFVAPGLFLHEKKLVLPLIVSSTLLFIIGMAFCYFFVFGVVFGFIQQFAPQTVSVAPDIASYFGFAVTMFMAFGLTFEVPVVVVVLVRTGLVTVQKLTAVRSYVIVLAFVIAAIVTPPDVMSQLMLAIPLCLLYEVGLLVARLFVKPVQE